MLTFLVWLYSFYYMFYQKVIQALRNSNFLSAFLVFFLNKIEIILIFDFIIRYLRREMIAYKFVIQ